MGILVLIRQVVLVVLAALALLGTYCFWAAAAEQEALLLMASNSLTVEVVEAEPLLMAVEAELMGFRLGATAEVALVAQQQVQAT